MLAVGLAVVAVVVWRAGVPRERGAVGEPARKGEERPHILLLLADDLGVNDLGSYHQEGSSLATLHTPHLDLLAAEGMRYTDFAVAAAVCSPSRAALLTGSYPPRVGFTEDMASGVIKPASRAGLHPDEVTLAEVLRAAGYQTALLGKWHLGHTPELLPTRQGFDDFFGVPYSHDLSPLPLMRDEEIVRRLPDNPLITGQLVQAMRGFFAARDPERPFFLMVSFTAPHWPWAVPAEWEGHSSRGPYGDVVEHLDASIGEMLAVLEAQGVADDTLVLFLSDNGPWQGARVEAGDSYPLRGGKAEPWEGGYRSPLLVRWPGRVPAGEVSDAFWTSLDLLPTLASVAGAPMPDRAIDGLDAQALLFDAGAGSPRDTFAYYARGRLEAVRVGHLKRVYAVEGRQEALGDGLYDLASDPREARDLFAERPEDVARLDAFADTLRARLGDGLRGVTGAERRPLASY